MKSVTRACGALSLLCLAAALSAPALGAALTDSKSFNVTVNLTPVCTVSLPASLSLDYQDNQNTAATGFSSFTATCTQGVAYNLSLGGAGLTTPTSGNTLYSGLAAGLTYTLEIQDAANGNSPVDPTADVTAANGNAKGYRVFGSIAANQQGICANGDAVSTTVNTCSATSVARTLTLTY
jgi:spore coat protein U-like protein